MFGEGPVGARLMLVGEQPGDQEDLAGKPFVGPAGKMLDKALAEAGVDRTEVYVTNVVKHFKNEPRGKRRLHKKPNRSEVEVCKVWLDQEIALVRPQLVLAMGVTAASALAGKAVTLSKERGKEIAFADGQRGMVTIHPSAILRAPDEAGPPPSLRRAGQGPETGAKSRRQAAPSRLKSLANSRREQGLTGTSSIRIFRPLSEFTPARPGLFVE